MKERKNYILISNNKYVNDTFQGKIDLIYKEDYNYMEILEFVRDKIHEGHKLLTHPLSGSIKPNETPYKSIIISKEKSDLDLKSLSIIEEAILTARKFLDNEETPNWTEKVLDDFRVIDLSLIENVIKN